MSHLRPTAAFSSSRFAGVTGAMLPSRVKSRESRAQSSARPSWVINWKEALTVWFGSGLSTLSSQLPSRSLALLVLLAFGTPGRGNDFASLCADRTAIERVYYQHRLGTKLPFEQTFPTTLIEQRVHDDLRKESVLKKNYGTEITADLIETEVQRIDAATRAPAVLAELKAALGGDAVRFARAFARPLVVERLLRARFENDEALHAARRHEAEQARASLLAKKPVKDLSEVTWQLTPRPANDQPAPATASTPTKISARSSAYTNEATVQIAQVLSSPAEEKNQKKYFEELDHELQKVLQAQLKKPGDVSAVIETPGGYLVFLAQEKTATTLSAATFSLPKYSLEEWLTRQSPENPS